MNHLLQSNTHAAELIIEKALRETDGELYSELSAVLGCLRGLTILYQSFHWQCSGINFYEDHLLFERLYNETNDEIDGVAERSVGLNKETLVDPFIHIKMAYGFIHSVKDYTNSNESTKLALYGETLFMDVLTSVMNKLENYGKLTRGLEQLLGNIADKHESHIYLLKQRCKT